MCYQTIENEREEQKYKFFRMLIATLVANFLVNVSAGKAYILGQELIRAGKIAIRARPGFLIPPNLLNNL